jgi:hypothetical protein
MPQVFWTTLGAVSTGYIVKLIWQAIQTVLSLHSYASFTPLRIFRATADEGSGVLSVTGTVNI